MKIKKLLHSCLLIEEAGTRILIDPGDYVFAEQTITPESLGPIDALLITHNHSDHCDLEAITKIHPKKIFGSAATQATLRAHGLTATVIQPGETIQIGEVSVQGIRAPHDPRLTSTPPESIGFCIGGKLLHPGDSLDFDIPAAYEVLALPIAAPWMVRKEALDLAVKLKPKHIIPIHDGMLKSFVAKANAALLQRYVQPSGSSTHPLGPGEILEI